MYMYLNTFWKQGVMSFGSNLYNFGQISTFAIHAIGVLFNGLHGRSFTRGWQKYAPQSDPTSNTSLWWLQGWEVGVDGGNSLGQEGYPAAPYCSLDCQNLALTWSSYLVLPES